MNGFDLARSLNKLCEVKQAYTSLNEAGAMPASSAGITNPPPLPHGGMTQPIKLHPIQGQPIKLHPIQGQPAQVQQDQGQAKPAQGRDKMIAGIRIGPGGVAQLPNAMIGTPQQRKRAVRKRMAYAEAMAKRYPDGIALITKFDWPNDDKLIYGPLINASWERIKGKFTPEQAKDIMEKFSLNSQRWSAWKIKTPRDLWNKLADWNRRNIIGRRAEIQQRDPKWGTAKPVIWTNDPFADG